MFSHFSVVVLLIFVTFSHFPFQILPDTPSLIITNVPHQQNTHKTKLHIFTCQLHFITHKKDYFNTIKSRVVEACVLISINV